MKLRADITLKEMARTFVKNNRKYGDNWEVVGRVFKALYPNGIQLRSEYDFILFHWMSWKIGKLTRFVQTNHTHQDSIHDDAVYTAMLETLIKTYEHKGRSKRKLSSTPKVSSRKQTLAKG